MNNDIIFISLLLLVSTLAFLVAHMSKKKSTKTNSTREHDFTLCLSLGLKYVAIIAILLAILLFFKPIIPAVIIASLAITFGMLGFVMFVLKIRKLNIM